MNTQLPGPDGPAIDTLERCADSSTEFAARRYLPRRRTILRAPLTGLAAVLLALAMAMVPLTTAPPSSAAGWTTIFPNYGDWNCGMKGGVVVHVKVAAFPGQTTVNAQNQRWARIGVASRGRVKLVANIYCVYGFLRTPGGWVTVEDYVTNAVPWKSYYF